MGLLTFDTWFPTIRPYLAESLVDGRAWEGLRTVAGHLPGEGLAIFEVRLASEARVVDLSIRLAEPAQARRMAERFSPEAVRTFLARWSQEESDLQPLSEVWLEFDLDPEPASLGTGSLPLPLLCARLRDAVEPEWLLGTLVPALRGEAPNGQQLRLLRRLVNAVPAGGRVLYAFGLLARPGGAVRLEISGLDAHAAVDYLERVAPENAPQVAGLCPLIGDSERLHLSLDVGETISPRIGIETSFVRRPSREPRWREFLDRLSAAGLCTREKLDAVFGWPGVDSLWTAPRRWPADAVGLGGYCVRFLSHVKLVSWTDREPEAKAYLGVQHVRRPARG